MAALSLHGIRTHGLAALCLAAVGCSIMQIKSVKTDAAVEPLDKLFVLVVEDARVAEPVFTELANWWEVCMPKRGVETKVQRQAVLVLDESEWIPVAQAFGAPSLLFLKPVAGVVDEFGNVVRLSWDVSLLSEPSGDRVWRAQVNSSGGATFAKFWTSRLTGVISWRLQETGSFGPSGSPIPTATGSPWGRDRP